MEKETTEKASESRNELAYILTIQGISRLIPQQQKNETTSDMLKRRKSGIACLQNASKLGFSPANTYIGYAYYMGLGVQRDLLKALLCFRNTAERGDGVGQYYYGMLLSDNGNMEEGILWLKYAIENIPDNIFLLREDKRQLIASSATMLAEYYSVEYSMRNENDPKEKLYADLALKYSKISARCGDVVGMYLYGSILLSTIESDNEMPDKDVETYLSAAAEKNFVYAQFAYARYLYNEGRKKEAFKWFKRAADNGHPVAQEMLEGLILETSKNR